MERLWAPWRMQYIATSDLKTDGCVFCEAVKADDRERLILHRAEHTFTIMNLFPYTNGHLMVVPYRHVGDITLLTPEERLEMMDGAATAVEIMRKALRCDGNNLGCNLGRPAGAGIADHVHLHVVPRWSGDTNFMPVLDDTRVISEGMEQTYDRLLAFYEKL